MGDTPGKRPAKDSRELATSAPTSAFAIAERRTRLRRAPFAGESLEAAIGVEPMMEVLQTSALPLGYAAPARASLTTTKGRRQSTWPLSSASPCEGRLERVKGLEPSTFCMASRRSSQLSYTRSKAG